jgi:hypothetical protein
VGSNVPDGQMLLRQRHGAKGAGLLGSILQLRSKGQRHADWVGKEDGCAPNASIPLAAEVWIGSNGNSITALIMRKFHSIATVSVLSFLLFRPCISGAQIFTLDSAAGLQPHDVTVEAVTYQGRKAVRVLPAVAADAELAAAKNGEGGGIAVLHGASFHNGTIEVDVAGKSRTGAVPDSRGFVGVAFRVSDDPSKYECFYIRPTNGRADDQLRRNHSTQYISMPE